MLRRGMNLRFVNEASELLRRDWNSLGGLVRAQTLDAVARHFLDLGLTELCLEALTGVASDGDESTRVTGDRTTEVDG